MASLHERVEIYQRVCCQSGKKQRKSQRPRSGDEVRVISNRLMRRIRYGATGYSFRPQNFMGRLTACRGRFVAANSMAGAHRLTIGYTRLPGPVDLFLRPWEVDVSRRTSTGFAVAGTSAGSQPEGHYAISCTALGWYNEPLTVVMQGDDSPAQRTSVCQVAKCAPGHNGDQRIEETRKGTCHGAKRPDRLIRIVIIGGAALTGLTGATHDLARKPGKLPHHQAFY